MRVAGWGWVRGEREEELCNVMEWMLGGNGVGR